MDHKPALFHASSRLPTKKFAMLASRRFYQRINRLSPRLKIASRPAMIRATSMENPTTNPVYDSVCFGVGQTTFFSSDRTSRRYLRDFAPLDRVVLPLASILVPISACVQQWLSRFAMHCMGSAPPTIFPTFQPIWIVLLIFCGRIVAALALATGQCNDRPHVSLTSRHAQGF